MKKKAHYGLLIAILFVSSFLLHACAQRTDSDERSDARQAVDFGDIADGTHRGRFTYGAFIFIVDVIAQDGEVIDIIVVQNRDNDPSREAEAVVRRIVEAQSLDVDLVSGATASSRALLQAAENAIRSAIVND